MPPLHQTQLLAAALHIFQAGQLILAAYEAQESPLMVKAVMRRLEGTKTLAEFIEALQGVVQGAR